jgi:hypothetical protein
VGIPYHIPFVVKFKRPKSPKTVESFNNKLLHIRKLVLHVTGFFDQRMPVEITFEGDTVYRLEQLCKPESNDYANYYEDFRETLEINKRNFIRALKEINIASWDKEYIDSEILDGTQWNFEIEYNDGKKKKYSGSNDFPDNFEELCELFGIDLGWENEEE